MTRQHMAAWLGWLLALCVAAAMLGLGLWQLERRAFKQDLLDAQSRALQAAPHTLSFALASGAAVARVADCGRWQGPVLVLDNQQLDGRAGHRSLQPWRSEEGALVLVEQGWRAWSADRQLPVAEPGTGPQCLQGLLLPAPAAGLRAGPDAPQPLPGRGWLLTRLEGPGLRAALGQSGVPAAGRILRPQQPLLPGYRLPDQLLPNTLPPDKHLGYAVQWFAMAATVLLLAVILSVRHLRGRRRRSITREASEMAVAGVSMARRGRGRLVLMLLFGIFLGSAAIALLLRASGWQPAASRQHGQLYSPAIDARALPPVHADGQPFAWQPEQRMWRVVVPTEPDCDAACVDLSQNLNKVWQLLGHTADNVQFLWLGTMPEGQARMAAHVAMARSDALRSVLPGLPDSAGIPVYVIDPNGFVVLRYAPGFDPAGLRADLAKLLKLK